MVGLEMGRLPKGTAVVFLGVLAACARPAGWVDPETGYIAQLPESVLEIADPTQNLDAVQLNPDDNCYWYRYDGPVETTMLPLRTTDGRPICVARKKKAG